MIDPLGRVKGLNVGLGCLSSSLMQKGHRVVVLDLNNNTRNVKERLNRIKDSDVIGVSIKSSTAQVSREIGEALGRKDLVCGGAHITIDGPSFLRNSPSFKSGAIGEAEETAVELIAALKSRATLRGVKGLIFKEGENLVVNPRRTVY